MSEYINKSDLYKEIAKLEKLARDRYLDTPIESPVFVRYQSQLNERTNLKHLIADFPAFDFDRLRELTQADKEGRCLVLPCKVGDTYYTIQKTCSDGGYAKKGEYFPCESDCEYCDIRDCDKEFIIREHKFNSLNFIVDCMEYIGEFLFLTKEEAEKALEGLK